MNNGILAISLQGLLYAFLPALFVLFIMWRWEAGAGTAVHAMLRMLVQLFAIGYVLIYIFESDSYWLIAGVLTIMIVVASWIAVRPLGGARRQSWPNSLLAVGFTVENHGNADIPDLGLRFDLLRIEDGAVVDARQRLQPLMRGQGASGSVGFPRLRHTYRGRYGENLCEIVSS